MFSDDQSDAPRTPPPAPPKRKVVRRSNEAETPSTAREAPPEVIGDQTALSLPPLRAPYIQKNFVGALVLGSVFALAGISSNFLVAVLGLIGPIACVVGFWVFGVRAGWGRYGDTRQRFADACYFLGFLFTMWALMVGFIPSGLGFHKLDSSEILRHFGMALGATAAGLIFRIMVLQGGGVGDDAAQVEADLHAYAARVSDEARSIVDELAQARSQLIETQRSAFTSMTERFEGTLSDLATRLSNAASAIETKLTGSANRAERAADDFQIKVGENESGLREAADAAMAAHRQSAMAIGEVARELPKLHATLTEAQSSLTTAMNDTADEVTALGAAINNQGANAEVISDAIGAIGAGIQATQSDIEELGNAAREGKEAVLTAAKIHVELRADVAEQLKGQRAELLELLAKDSDKFSADMVSAADTLVAIVEKFTVELERMRGERRT